jgi:hypothetical protein
VGTHNLSTAYPTHNQVGGVDVVCIGWALAEPSSHSKTIYSLEDDVSMLPALLTAVNISNADVIVYAVWGYDEDGDGIADILNDKYEIIIHYVNRNHESIGLPASTSRIVSKNADFTVVPPTIAGYIYVGWYELNLRLRNTPTIRVGEPIIENIMSEIDIFLVYGRDYGSSGDPEGTFEPDGIEDFDITRRWESTSGEKLRADEVLIWNIDEYFDMSASDGFDIPADYKYIGYRLSSDPGVINSGIPNYLVNVIDGDVSITYIFNKSNNPSTGDIGGTSPFITLMMTVSLIFTAVWMLKRRRVNS